MNLSPQARAAMAACLAGMIASVQLDHGAPGFRAAIFRERRPSAWRSDPLPKRPDDPLAAAFYRARRAQAKARSRAMGHGG